MPETLLSLWEATMARSPRAFAFCECARSRSWTRSEVASEVAAWRLAQAGADLRGRSVVLAEANGIGWMSAFLGLISAGALPVLVDSAEPAQARASVAREVGASAIVAEGKFWAVAAGRRARKSRFCLAKVTSGSTGIPKSHPFTDAQMIADGAQICSTMKIGEDDLNLATIPFGHSYGLGNLIVPFLAQGTAIACGSGPFPEAIAHDCLTWRPTVFPAVPTILRALVRSNVAAEALASLRLVISAGSPLSPGDARAFKDRFDRAVHTFYGSTETGGICFDRTGESTLSGASVGLPLDGVRLIAGGGSRFLVESPAVMGRGRKRPSDLGCLTDRGELKLLGRAGRMIKVGGKRLDPSEVEAALKGLPGVQDAVVLAHPEREDAIAAAVVSSQKASAIKAALIRKLAPWKVPDRMVILPHLPTTSRGKSDLRGIEELFRSRPG